MTYVICRSPIPKTEKLVEPFYCTVFPIAGLLETFPLSFCGSKMILVSPNHFGRVPIVLDESNLFWSDPNPLGQVQIIKKNSPDKSNLNLTQMFRTRPKQYGPDQNKLYPSKTICMVQNNFGPIEGQGTCLPQKYP